jgi:hypothetical protein
MGNSQSQALADLAGVDISLENALYIHLQSNHYPAVNPVFIPTAVEAIDKANEGDWGYVQTYPNGLERTVADTVEGLHLNAYLDDDEDSI